MIVTFYTHMKKSRSTSRPSTGGTEVDCYLKDGTSRRNPVFMIEWPEMPTWNMCTAFDNAYYRITDVVAIHDGLYALQCTVDLLATHKNSIVNSDQFVAYYQGGSTRITDSRNPITTNVESKWVFANNIVKELESEPGCYILTVASSVPTRGGGMTAAFAMDAGNLAVLAQQLFDESIIEQLQKYFAKPFESIISCHWLPISASKAGSGSQPIFLGGYLTNASGTRLAGFHKSIGSECITIPYPEGCTGYLKYAPYCSFTVFLPFVGVVDLDPKLASDDSFTISAEMSMLSGDIVYNVYGKDDAMIATFSGNCAMNVPIAQVGYDAIGQIVGAVQSIGGVAMMAGGSVQAGFGMLMAGEMGLVQSSQITTQVNGALRGGVGAYNLIPRAMLFYNRPATESISALASNIGLPYFKKVSMNSLRGYIQTVNADMQSVAELDEIAEVCAIMDGGFWLE